MDARGPRQHAPGNGITRCLSALHDGPGSSSSGPYLVRHDRRRDEMRRALESLRRSVDEDGSPESEFALALALAVGRRVVGRVH